MKKIIVLSLSSCTPCTMAKRYLDTKGVPYEVIDINESRDLAESYLNITNFRKVPQVILEEDGEVKGSTKGFDPEGIDKLLTKYKNNSNLRQCYEIIKDEVELQKFVDQLPDLGERFKYYISLFARKKYGGTEGLKSDKAQLKRCVASKGTIIKKLKQMEIPVGCYDIDGTVINQESLVVYISANPRDMHKAGVETAIVLTKKGLHGEIIKNPQAEALNQIQVHGKKIYFNVDLDIIEGQELSEQELLDWIDTCINLEACTIVKTRGGYHILIKLDDIDDLHKRWYTFFKLGDDKLIDRFTVDLSNGDGMLPVPGCVQAEFIPRML